MLLPSLDLLTAILIFTLPGCLPPPLPPPKDPQAASLTLSFPVKPGGLCHIGHVTSPWVYGGSKAEPHDWDYLHSVWKASGDWEDLWWPEYMSRTVAMAGQPALPRQTHLWSNPH